MDISLLFALLILPLAVFVVVLIVSTTIIYLIKKKKQTSTSNNFWKILAKTTVILILISIVGTVVFIYIPTKRQDNAFIKKQLTCSKQVGYTSPDDDNSSTATAQTQSNYSDCLNSSL